jgi:ubiquinone/menaquinone biosynthesis C-methylase UbiE
MFLILPINPVRTKWNPNFDDKPTSDVPRIKFSLEFSQKYLDKGCLILEIGCGIGSYTWLVDRINCLAIDIDFDVVKVAKKYCSNSNFIVASALNLPFRAETVDLICMWSVLEETPVGSERQIITEIRKILTFNGVVLLSVYTNHILSKMLDPRFIFRGIRHHDHKKFFNLISECGLLVNEYTVRGGLNTLVSNFLVYFYKHVLKKKDGTIKKYFDKKSADEINSGVGGLVYMFIAAHKKNNTDSELL